VDGTRSLAAERECLGEVLLDERGEPLVEVSPHGARYVRVGDKRYMILEETPLHVLAIDAACLLGGEEITLTRQVDGEWTVERVGICL
jgi:hypothetical protein